METAMRAQRQKVKLLQQGGADPDDVVIAKAKYQAQLQEYKSFCKGMDLTPQMERVYIDGLGRVAPGKDVYSRYPSRMIRNATIDSKQYDRYKNIIGDSVGSLADFRDMKYNKPKEFELLKDYVNSVKKGMLSPLSGFDNYKNLHDTIEEKIVGITLSNGVKISGQSKHFIERVIGTKDDPKTHRPRNGVDIEDIKEALINGTIRERKKDPNSIKLVTEKCIVSVNPKTGILIQCNPN